jgi:hypothetical protein
MCACIILHNMVVDDERDDDYNDNYHTVTRHRLVSQIFFKGRHI